MTDLHVVARILTTSNHTVIAESKHAIHVPQMVYLEITDEAKAALQQDIYDDTNLVVQAFSQNQVNNLLWDIAGAITSYYEGVNVWVDDWNFLLPDYYSTVTFTTNHPQGSWGAADGPLDFGNVKVDDTARVFVRAPREYFYSYYTNPLTGPIAIPFTVEEQAFTFARTATHEIGHLFGLVSTNDVLKGHYWFGEGEHNAPPLTPLHIMNPAYDSLTNKIGRTPGGLPWVFRFVNHDYLRFVLPEP